MNEYQIEGKNPVIEAIRNEHEIDKILVLKGAGPRLGNLISLAKSQGIVVQEVEKIKLDTISQTVAHQGVIAFAAAVNYSQISDILKHAEDKNQPPFVVIAEGVTDPHNLGAIIRSANAAGANGVIIPKRRSVGVNATVAKVSAGAVESIPIVKVTNITSTIEELKKLGLWIIGTDLSGDRDLFCADLKGPIAVVIGSEGEGISRLVREKCDFLVKIPMLGDIESLNASVACGIILYEVVRQRKYT